jgi:hypothetical protein
MSCKRRIALASPADVDADDLRRLEWLEAACDAEA